ncbi:hypothetical protein [Clostridium sp. CTA-6]
MNKIKVKDLLCITGGNTKVVIYDINDNSYKELWKGIVDDIDFNNVPYANNEVEHQTVVNDEDILQIHIRFIDKNNVKQYFDKNNKEVKDYNYLICEEEVCQALRCDDGTLLYEILILKKNGELDLKDDFYYPDAYESKEIEIINKEKAIELLTKI